LRSHRLDEAMYLRGQALFGEKALVEIVGIIGYYTMVAYTLNAFGMVKE
jgi:4-carboxymuconolactone decarboxylase